MMLTSNSFFRNLSIGAVCLGTIGAFSVPVLGLLCKQPNILYAMAEGHGGRVLIFWTFIMFISWLTEQHFREKEVVWIDLFWLGWMSLFTIAFVLTFSVKTIADSETITKILLFTPVLFLAVVAASSGGGTQAPDGKADANFLRWGHFASLGLMVLALFAFGIHKNEQGVTDVHWSEVPAILIVFVLAELGVALMTKAEAIISKAEAVISEADAIKVAVRTAANNARETTANAQNVIRSARVSAQLSTAAAASMASQVEGRANITQRTLQEAMSGAKTALDQLGRIEQRILETLQTQSRLLREMAPIVDQPLWKTLTQRGFHDVLGITKEADFWDKVDHFATRWDPTGGGGGEALDVATRQLVGGLFNVFVGVPKGGVDPEGLPARYEFSGTVLPTEDGISCITADAVFASASREWLEGMRDSAVRRKDKLIVWALTRLLPTDFAFPSLWWTKPVSAGGSRSEQPARVSAINAFVDSVMDTCHPGLQNSSGVQYRRITLFPEPPLITCQPDEENRPEKLFGDEVQGLDHSLDEWLIWDPRTGDWADPLPYGRVRTCSTDLLNAFLSAFGYKAEVNLKDRLRYEKLWGSRGIATSETGDRDRRMRTFPRVLLEDHVYLFDVSFSAFEDAPTGGVIGASGEFLNRGIPWDKVSAGLEPDVYDFLQCGTAGANPKDEVTPLSLLTATGWMTLRDWYRCKLHTEGTSPGLENAEAFWATIDATGIEKLKSLQLNWDGWQVDTFDLLLIGSLPSGGTADEDIRWYGAAISNLQFDRTECTVRLVTERQSLHGIFTAVTGLLPKGDGFVKRGRWLTWPQIEERHSAPVIAVHPAPLGNGDGSHVVPEQRVETTTTSSRFPSDGASAGVDH